MMGFDPNEIDRRGYTRQEVKEMTENRNSENTKLRKNADNLIAEVKALTEKVELLEVALKELRAVTVTAKPQTGKKSPAKPKTATSDDPKVQELLNLLTKQKEEKDTEGQKVTRRKLRKLGYRVSDQK